MSVTSRGDHPTMAPDALAPSRMLRSLGLHARKGLGQHFLTSTSALHHILEALSLEPQSTVVEIGAGLGTLTGYLAVACREVLAVELDADLARQLEVQFGARPSVRIVRGDILDLTPSSLFGETPPGYSVVGNLPYYITSAVLRHVLDWRPAPSQVVVMVQYEVARRLLAGPGDMSLLALMVQMKGVPRMVARVPAGAFVPPPKVSSAVVSIVPHAVPPASAEREAVVFRLARLGFQQRRKMLANSLSAGLGLGKDAVKSLLAAAAVPPTARAEDLNVSEWLALASALEARS